MKLYAHLASISEVSLNSRCEVSDLSLLIFTRIILFSSQSVKDLDWIKAAYLSGLFDGSGDVSYDHVEIFKNKILEEAKLFLESNSRTQLYQYFGVDIAHKLKNTSSLKVSI